MIDNVAKQDSQFAKFDEYRKLRDQSAQTVDDQLQLARWCEKVGLKEQQRAHLMFALELQPNNKEAISKLGLVRFHGQLVPATQLNDIKAKLDSSTAVSKEWKARVDGWSEQLKKHPNDVEILKQIRAVRDPAAIWALQSGLAYSGQDACLAVVDALAAMPQQAATDSLLHAAVFSPLDEVSRAAVYVLKKRSPYSYVPALLSAMQAPIRYEYDVLNFNATNFTHQLALSQEKPDSNNVVVYYDSETQGLSQQFIDDRASRTAARAVAGKARAAAIVGQVDHINKRAYEGNSILASVLELTTGQQFGTNVVSWWNWWYDENDYYSPPEKPENVTSQSTISYNRISCFVAGTLVWTAFGPIQIEKIKVGELVLAKDTETGELAYKPVIATTNRPTTELVDTRLGETLIRSTRGHPLWVSGKGWQMAKELKAGQWLHTAGGEVQIDSVEPSEEAVCYNLVVADFHDYFVSNAKVLVHDNLLRGPTLATVPGLAEAK